jgi:hypothetical protein
VPASNDSLDDQLPPLVPALLDDDDDLADAIARRVAQAEPGIAETAVLQSALDLVLDQVGGDGEDALALALAVLDERRDAMLFRLVRAAIIETVAAIRDADGILLDEEQRAWWLDRVLREDDEVRRLGDRLRRREERLRQLVDDEAWGAYLRLDEAVGARTAESHDAIVRTLLRGHPAPERGRR